MIEIELTYSVDDYLLAYKFMSRRQNRIFGGMIAVWLAVLALLSYRNPSNIEGWTIPLVFALLVFSFVLVRFIKRWNIGRQLKSAPAVKGPHVWSLDNDGIRISGPLSNTEIKWGAIISARESKDEFFFYTTKRFAQFLPKRVFTGEEQMSELRRLVIDSVGNRAKLI